MDIFISYSRTDLFFAEALFNSLTESLNPTPVLFSPWMDIKKLEPVQNWSHEIKKAVEGCTIFLLILSRNSYESPQVQVEIQQAISSDSSSRVYIVIKYAYEILPQSLANVSPDRLSLIKEKDISGIISRINAIISEWHIKRYAAQKKYDEYRSQIDLREGLERAKWARIRERERIQSRSKIIVILAIASVCSFFSFLYGVNYTSTDMLGQTTNGGIGIGVAFALAGAIGGVFIGSLILSLMKNNED